MTATQQELAMNDIKQYVTNLILNSDLDIDQVYESTEIHFSTSYTAEQIKQGFDEALSELPELN